MAILFCNFRKFGEKLASKALLKGMSMPMDPIDVIDLPLSERPDHQAKNVEILINTFTGIRKGFKDPSTSTFILAIVPSQTTRLYKHVKQASELHEKLYVLTQCIVKENVTKCRDAVVENILLKLNAKLGGVSQVAVPPTVPNFKGVDILSTPVLIIGIDVTHPAPNVDKVEFVWINY